MSTSSTLSVDSAKSLQALVQLEVERQQVLLRAELSALTTRIASVEAQLAHVKLDSFGSIAALPSQDWGPSPEAVSAPLFDENGEGAKIPSRNLLLHMPEDVGDEAEVVSMPESMFSYCMSRLSVSPNPWCDEALAYLLLLLACQQIMMITFCESNNIRMFSDQWAGKSQNTVERCLLSHRSFRDEPLADMAAASVAMILVAASIKSDDEQLFGAMYPSWQNNKLFWTFATVIWFMQAIYLPGCFGVAAATLFANSKDCAEITMNALAVAFILEIDDMMYTLLGPAQTSAYHKLASTYRMGPHLSHSEGSITGYSQIGVAAELPQQLFRHKTSLRAPQLLFAASLTFMYFMFFRLRFAMQQHPQEFEVTWYSSAAISYMGNYLARGTVQRLAWRTDKHAEQSWLRFGVTTTIFSIFSGVAGWNWYCLLAFLSSGNWYAKVSSCMHDFMDS